MDRRGRGGGEVGRKGGGVGGGNSFENTFSTDLKSTKSLKLHLKNRKYTNLKKS